MDEKIKPDSAFIGIRADTVLSISKISSDSTSKPKDWLIPGVSILVITLVLIFLFNNRSK